MTITSLGDLAQSFVDRRQNATIKQDINRLTSELASGRVGDLAAALSGDFGQLASVERAIATAQAYQSASREAGLFTQAQQSALQAVSDGLSTAASAMISAAPSEIGSVLNAAADEADSQFRMAVSTLNLPNAGRSLFAGTASGQPALRPAQDILDALAALTAGETSAAGIDAALDDWFLQPGGGFETFAYQGATGDMPPFLLGEGQTAGPVPSALDGGIRATLKALAMGALMRDGLVTSDTALRQEVLTAGGEAALAAKSRLTDTQAGIGTLQQRIEAQSVHLTSESAALEIARAEMVTADPFETATRLENAQFQLEALYAVTARTARLSLMDYLR
jgi:flagellar hook-associated protein 3 FlgL